MKTRVTFVLPDFPHFRARYGGTFAHGLASMNAVLREQGASVELIHLTRSPAREEFVARLRETRPDLIGMSTTTHAFPEVRRWISWAKAQVDAPVIVGGVHAILDPDDVMDTSEADLVCTGEGEWTLLELCRRLEEGRCPADVEGTWYRTADGIRRNPVRPLIENLAELPLPDYSIFDYERLYDAPLGRLTVMHSRGCSYRCTYCANAQLRSSYPNPRAYRRFMTPERAVENVRRQRAEHPGVREVLFNDNILYPNLPWFRAFVPLYRERVGLPYTANLRPEMATEEAVALLADSGCRTICLGVECGDEDIANRVLGRGQDNATIERAFSRFRAAGIRTVAYNILGSPFETVDTMLETVRLNARLRPDVLSPFIYYPFPRTESYELCRRHGFLTGRHGRNISDRVVIHQPTVRDAEVLFMQRFFRPLVRLTVRMNRWPAWVRRPGETVLEAALRSPLLPRRALVELKELYGRVRFELDRSAPAAGTQAARR